mgnify:CR=1 FL=1
MHSNNQVYKHIVCQPSVSFTAIYGHSPLLTSNHERIQHIKTMQDPSAQPLTDNNIKVLKIWATFDLRLCLDLLNE